MIVECVRTFFFLLSWGLFYSGPTVGSSTHYLGEELTSGKQIQLLIDIDSFLAIFSFSIARNLAIPIWSWQSLLRKLLSCFPRGCRGTELLK